MFISIRSFRVPASTCVSLTKHLLLHKARQGINKKESVWKMFPAWPQSLTLKKSQQVASRNVWVGCTCVVFLHFCMFCFWTVLFFLKKVLFILFLSIWAFFLHVYMYTVCMCVSGVQKRMVDFLDLETHMVVDYYVGAGNWTQDLWEVASVLNCWTISSVPVNLLTQDLQY